LLHSSGTSRNNCLNSTCLNHQTDQFAFRNDDLARFFASKYFWTASLAMTAALMSSSVASAAGEAAILTEGDRAQWMHIHSLGHLPLFTE